MAGAILAGPTHPRTPSGASSHAPKTAAKSASPEAVALPDARAPAASGHSASSTSESTRGI
eukprot:scaffold247091_cov35-Tisochrysis_lutea.AAC.1